MLDLLDLIDVAEAASGILTIAADVFQLSSIGRVPFPCPVVFASQLAPSDHFPIRRGSSPTPFLHRCPLQPLRPCPEEASLSGPPRSSRLISF